MRLVTVVRRDYATVARVAARAVVRDRRGAVSLLFTLSAVTFIGVAGLATEGGTWYLEKRHGQSAADAAAGAGALALVENQNAVTSGTNAAAAEGYTQDASTTVTITPGSSAGRGNFTAGGAPQNAVQAVISRTRPRLFSGLFLGSAVVIREAAVAAVLPDAAGGGCLLAGAGGLGFTGSTTVTGSNCVFASNATGTNAISVTGAATVNATGMVSSGGCSGCTGGGVTLQDPPMMFQPPTSDPFAAAGAVTLPTFSGSGCRQMPSLNGTVNLTPSTTQAFCSGQDLKLTNGNAVNLSPGTYFFYKSNIDIEGGTVQCPTCTPGGAGVTIIMAGGAQTGMITINGGATVILNAPAVNSWNSAFNGILFYRDSTAPANGNGNQPAVNINGGANTVLTGGLYFPSSNVQFSGNMTGGGAAASTCTELVGYSLTFTGNSGLDISACQSDGTAVAQPQSVQLVM